MTDVDKYKKTLGKFSMGGGEERQSEGQVCPVERVTRLLFKNSYMTIKHTQTGFHIHALHCHGRVTVILNK